MKNTLRGVFTNTKDKIPQQDKRDIIYKVECEVCDGVNIWQTSRTGLPKKRCRLNECEEMCV